MLIRVHLLVFGLVIGGTGISPGRGIAASPNPEQGTVEGADPTEFAFSSGVNDSVGIYLHSNGKDKLLTPTFKLAVAPSWSPDGTQIAFQAKVDGNSDIYVLSVASGRTTRLTSHSAADVHPAWSPDGSVIAFMSGREYEEDFSVICTSVQLMDPDGKNVRRFTNEIRLSQFPAWSPDGQSIAFCGPSIADTPLLRDKSKTKTEVSCTDIYVARRDGTRMRKLTDGKGDSVCPTWSADGTMIAFSSNRHGDPGSLVDLQIFVINADGSNLCRLTKLAGQHIAASWSPHKTKILFHSTASVLADEKSKTTAEVYVVNSDGTGLQRLTNNETDDYFPAWRPRSPAK